MGRGAVRHVSVRAPWHDNGWNGRVCLDARANSACLAIKRNAANRDDAFEAANAGKCFSELSSIPPCLAERGAFLSPRELPLTSTLDYSKYSPDHTHILPQVVPIPAYGGTLTPFRWMLRESAWEIAEEHGLDAEEMREPQEGQAPNLIVKTPWVQNHDNQRALLEGFGQELEEGTSLVFFYAKQTPLTDSGARQIVAVAKLTSKGPLTEYPYEGGSAAGRIRSMVWERPFQHSLRPNPKVEGAWLGGIVLPYHQLLELAKTQDLELSRFVAEVPQDGFEQFLYASEHVSHGTAITALQSVRRAIEASSTVLAGPWEDYLEWIDRELSELWTMHGIAPGLGSALSCFDENFNGTLFAHALAGSTDENADPWPVVEAIFAGEREAPEGAPKITTMQKRRFEHLKKSDPDGYALMQLLSRFELSRDQADAIFNGDHEAEEFLANPYRLFELSRNTANPIGLMTIDRSLFPTDKDRKRPPFHETLAVELDEPEDALRLRAIAVDALERAAAAGHTILSAGQLGEEVDRAPLSLKVSLDATTLEICKKDFAEEVDVTKNGDITYAQLLRYKTAGALIRAHVEERAKALTQPQIDWTPLIAQEFKGSAASEDERQARAEKLVALQKLERSRIGVLTGPAGTGKTTLLKILLNQPSVVGRDIQLLAPTGKARVRLGQQTGRPTQARTLAQFLLEHSRYSPDTGQYLVVEGGSTASVSTCVVDESSMLTEDQLAALCSVLPKTARLILVGDPQQLPPIGAGRPFVDIIAQLQDAHEGAGVAELSVSRRQDGGELVSALSLPDVQLASLFSGRALEPGEDEIIATSGTPANSDRLRFVDWETPADLREKLLEVLADELGADPSHLEPALEQSLGGTPSNGYIYFNEGAGAKAEEWQILSAHRNLASGSAELNRYLKQTVRADRLEKARNPGRGWRVIKPRGSDQITYGDKVICLRNHKRNRWSRAENQRAGYLANGEVGMVVGETGNRHLRFTNVEFASQKDDIYSFKDRDFSEEGNPFLELAYAVTVHKAQGSEFGSVILVLPANSRLLSREMLYTALTRQKNRVWVLHQGPFSHYLRLRSDFFSETDRRTTNLFGPPVMKQVEFSGEGGLRTGWLAEKLIHRTLRGDLVSSKSELIIADTLYQLEQSGQIRYSFEKPLSDPEGVTRYPDFTVEAGQETWFWEHCGLMGQSDYVKRWERKLKWYAAQGITRWSESNPSGRLIVTEDTMAGGIDSGAIHQLANRLFATSE